MGFEYSVWAKSALYDGEIDDQIFPGHAMALSTYDVLAAAPSKPPFLGTAKKKFDDFFTELFMNFGNRLLSPDDARKTARCLRDWMAVADDAAAAQLAEALRTANWLERAASDGWFIDWST